MIMGIFAGEAFKLKYDTRQSNDYRALFMYKEIKNETKSGIDKDGNIWFEFFMDAEKTLEDYPQELEGEFSIIHLGKKAYTKYCILRREITFGLNEAVTIKYSA